MDREPVNLLFIGMPSAGKTTVGALVADLLGLPFYDFDRVIEANTGRTVPEIFHEDGESAFRALEHETALALAEKNIRPYCLGGGINRLALSTGGSLAEENIRLVQVDYLLFSSQGLDWDGAITDYSEDETKLRRLMLRHSKKRYFLCDSDKVGQRMLFNVCAADDLDGVISDADVSRIPGIRWIPAEG